MSSLVRLFFLVLISTSFLLPGSVTALSGEANAMCKPYIAECPCNQVLNKWRFMPGQPKCKAGGEKNGAGYSNTHACGVGVCKDVTNEHVTQGVCIAAGKCEGKYADDEPVKKTDVPVKDGDKPVTAEPPPPPSASDTGDVTGGMPQKPDVPETTVQDPTKDLQETPDTETPVPSGSAKSVEDQLKEAAGEPSLWERWFGGETTPKPETPVQTDTTVGLDGQPVQTLRPDEVVADPLLSDTGVVQPQLGEPTHTFGDPQETQSRPEENSTWWGAVKETATNAWEGAKDIAANVRDTVAGALTSDTPSTPSIGEIEMPPPPAEVSTIAEVTPSGTPEPVPAGTSGEPAATQLNTPGGVPGMPSGSDSPQPGGWLQDAANSWDALKGGVSTGIDVFKEAAVWRQVANEVTSFGKEVANSFENWVNQDAQPDRYSDGIIDRAQESVGLTPPQEAPPIRVGSDGKIDPVDFYNKAVEKFANSSLNGVTPEWGKKFGIDGTPESWARFATKLAVQESGLQVANVNPDGSLQRFPTTLSGEQSYGPLQFNKGEYGLNTWADVNDPGRNIDALINVAERGRMEAYFGPVQRPNEVNQNTAWFNETVAPYVQQSGGSTQFAGNTPASQSTEFSSVSDQRSSFSNQFTSQNTPIAPWYEGNLGQLTTAPAYSPGNFEPASPVASYDGNPWSSTGNSVPPEFSYNGPSPEDIYNATVQGQRENAGLSLENVPLHNQGPGFSWSPASAIPSEQVFGGPSEGAGLLQQTSSFDNIAIQTLQGTPVGGESSVPVPDTWTPSGQAVTQDIYNSTEQGQRENAALALENTSLYNQGPGFTWSPSAAVSSEQVFGGPSEDAGQLQPTNAFDNIAVQTLQGTPVNGESSVPTPDTSIQTGEQVTANVLASAQSEVINQTGLDARLSEADRQWEEMLTSASNPPKEFSSFYDAVGMPAGNIPEPIALSGEGAPQPNTSVDEAAEAGETPAEANVTEEPVEPQSQPGLYDRAVGFLEEQVKSLRDFALNREFSSLPSPEVSQTGEQVTQSVLDATEQVPKLSPDQRIAEAFAPYTWQPDVPVAAAGSTPEPIALSGEGGPQPKDASGSFAIGESPAEPIQNPLLPRERPNAFVFDEKSDIGKKGVDSNEFMSKAISGYDNLSPLAKAQAADALRNALVDNPDVAKELLGTNKSVIRGDDVVFPNKGTLNLDALKDSDFQKDFADNIKSDERILTRELGGLEKVESFAQTVGQPQRVPTQTSSILESDAGVRMSSEDMNKFLDAAGGIVSPLTTATKDVFEATFPEAYAQSQQTQAEQDAFLSAAGSDVSPEPPEQALSKQEYLEAIEQNEFLNAAGSDVSPESSAQAQQMSVSEQDQFLDAVGADVSPDSIAKEQETAELNQFLDAAGSNVSPAGNNTAEVAIGQETDLTSVPENATVPDAEGNTTCLSESCVGGRIGDDRSRPATDEQKALQDKIDQDYKKLTNIERNYKEAIQRKNDAAETKGGITTINKGLKELNKAVNSLGTLGNKDVMASGLAEASSLAKDLREYGNPTLAKSIDDYVASVPQIGSVTAGRAAVATGNGLATQATVYLNGRINSANATISQYDSLQSQITSNTNQLLQLSVQQAQLLAPTIPSNWPAGTYTPSQALPTNIPPLGSNSWTMRR